MYVITVIKVIKRHVLVVVNYRRAVEKLARVEESRRNRSVTNLIKVRYLTLTRDSIAKWKLATVLTSSVRVEFEFFAFAKVLI